MECKRLEQYLNEHDCARIAKDSDLHLHLRECPHCQKYYLFENILRSQKEIFEKAPEAIVPTVRQRIFELQRRRERSSMMDILRLLVKPAIGFSILFIAVAFYMHVKNGPIGVVNNLADRFNRSEFKNIKAGDILYASKHIHVDLTLANHSKLYLDSNTLLQFRAKDKITLSRGRLYLAAGGDEMKIETPNGLITVKNAKTKISANRKEEKDAAITKTSCSVIEGIVQIENSKGISVVSSGQEIVLAENGKIESKNVLPDSAISGQASRIYSVSSDKVFTAKEQLCDCLYDIRYNPDNNALHDKELKENKFPVRVFWRNKEKIESMRRLDEPVCFFNGSGGSTRDFGNSPGI